MSKKANDQQAANATPFFAHLLSSDRDPASTSAEPGGTTPTYPCIDEPCTKKYPSDDDESTTWIGDKD